MMVDYTYRDIAKMIDHSLLQPATSLADLEKGCRLAREYDVASVCILPYAAHRCAEILAGSTVHVSTTIGFPHGGHTTATKLVEAKQALEDGAVELDMVVNISQVLSGGLGLRPPGYRAGRGRGPRAGGEGEGDLRELLPQPTSRRSRSAASAARSGRTG